MFPVLVAQLLADPTVWRVGVLVLAVALAVAAGLVRRRRDGAAREVGARLVVTAAEVGGSLGRHATLLQVSTTFCQPCRLARRVLGEVAAGLPGVAHVEVDAQEHPDLVRRLDVTRAPTIFVLDGHGRVTQRAQGVPTKAQVLAALDRQLPAGALDAAAAPGVTGAR